MAKKFKTGAAVKFTPPVLRGIVQRAVVNDDSDLHLVVAYVCPVSGQLKESLFEPEQLEADETPVELPAHEEHEPIKQTIFVEGEGPAAADAPAA